MSENKIEKYEGWTLAVDVDEARVRDLDLAERLKYPRARKIRELIARMIEEGEIGGVQSRPTVGRQSTGNGGERTFSIDEYWLTEEQALLVAARSGMPAAIEVRRTIVRAFIALRRGSFAAPALDEAALARISANAVTLALVPIMERLARIEAGQDRAPGGPTHTGTIGDEAALTVCSGLRNIATMRVAAHVDAPDYRRRRKCEISRANRELRRHLKMPDGRVADFPASLRPEIDAWILWQDKNAERQAGISSVRVRREQRGQTTIYEAVKPKPN